jgi:transposase
MGEEHRQLSQRTRRGFSKEFKRDAVKLVRSSGRPIAAVARELGIYDSTLGNWVRQDRIDRGEAEGLTTEERVRLRQLEAENTRLRMERDLLKRIVAFWVKETSTPWAATAESMPRRPTGFQWSPPAWRWRESSGR